MAMDDLDGNIWKDGKLLDWRDVQIHVLPHSLHYGMTVLEGVRAYKTEQGSAVFRLKEHTKRLFNSAKIFSDASTVRHAKHRRRPIGSIAQAQVGIGLYTPADLDRLRENGHCRQEQHRSRGGRSLVVERLSGRRRHQQASSSKLFPTAGITSTC